MLSPAIVQEATKSAEQHANGDSFTGTSNAMISHELDSLADKISVAKKLNEEVSADAIPDDLKATISTVRSRIQNAVILLF